MLVFTKYITPRLQYIVKTLFENITEEISFETDSEKFLLYDGIKINYSAQKISPKEIQVVPHNLLFEENIHTQHIEIFKWKGLTAFFKTNSEDIPFDIFASAFFLLTRYEEYLSYKHDVYGRYPHTESAAFKHGFLQQPLIHLWMQQVMHIIQNKFSSSYFKQMSFQFLPTYDIDIAYNYLHKSFFTHAAAFSRDILKGKWKQLYERFAVYAGFREDPFYTFNWLDSLHEQYQLQPVYFFLMAKRKTGVDRNISPASDSMQLLVKEHAKKYIIGIHPSWQSGNDESVLKSEIQSIAGIASTEIIHSRQHYIKMSLPVTYRRLLQNGIQHEYSMGYGSINGFRCSYTLPHKWFDVETNEITRLQVYPFCFMEANSKFEQLFSAEQALEEMQYYYKTVKAVKGVYCTVFHNHFITTQPNCIEWRKMYKTFLDKNC